MTFCLQLMYLTVAIPKGMGVTPMNPRACARRRLQTSATQKISNKKLLTTLPGSKEVYPAKTKSALFQKTSIDIVIPIRVINKI